MQSTTRRHPVRIAPRCNTPCSSASVLIVTGGLLVLLLGGCASRSASKQIPAAGGSVDVMNTARVDVPAGAFGRPGELTVRRVATPADAGRAFGTAAALFDVEDAGPYEVEIASSAGQPRQPVWVDLAVPTDLRRTADRKAAANDPDRPAPRLRVFARNVWTEEGGAAGRLVTYEPLPKGFAPGARRVSVEVPPHAFAPAGPDGRLAVAVLRLGLTRTAVGEGGTMVFGAMPHARGAFGLPAAAHGPGNGDGHACGGLRLAPPLRGQFRQQTPFGPGADSPAADAASRFHPGTDYAPDGALGAAGLDVLAMADGRVVAIGTQPDAHGGGTGGWGHHIVLGHGLDGGGPYTLYAHLDDSSAPRVTLGEQVNRGQTIGRLAAGEGDAQAEGEGLPAPADLHVELIPRGGRRVKADPHACLTRAFVERLVAGYRATAVIRPPAFDTDAQSIELSGNRADNAWWPGGATARTTLAREGRTLNYTGEAVGRVVTLVDDEGLRLQIKTTARGNVRGKFEDDSVPAGASAGGNGGARIRFRTAGPARYRLAVRYHVAEAGQWSIDTRFRRAADGDEKELSPEYNDMPRTGDGPADFDQTFVGRLEQAGAYDFDFLPGLTVGGGATRAAAVDATVVLEVLPERQ